MLLSHKTRSTHGPVNGTLAVYRTYENYTYRHIGSRCCSSGKSLFLLSIYIFGKPSYDVEIGIAIFDNFFEIDKCIKKTDDCLVIAAEKLRTKMTNSDEYKIAYEIGLVSEIEKYIDTENKILVRVTNFSSNPSFFKQKMSEISDLKKNKNIVITENSIQRHI